MKYFVLLLILFSTSLKAQGVGSDKDFADKVLDLVLLNLENESIELEHLYEKTIDSIPALKDEKSVLVEKLKARGFKVTIVERGNYPPNAVRVLIYTLKKDDCACEVAKIYYVTTFDSVYIRKEKVSCKKTSR